jgi:diaminohydroxyphosphoribosylaminopyrimidine deaminase/5-amino-6-(5-phosphoribosylamino)uracil reductase
MARALRLAARGLHTTDPNPRVGCVVAAGDRVVGEGFHELAGGPHAEVAALAAAGSSSRGATAYVTLEPCSHHGRTPPCADALIAAGITRVVYASGDPNPRVNGSGAARLREAGIEVDGGLLERQARALNPGFYSRMERGRPWVRLKLACSLDGRTALASGESRWITSEPARQDVQRLRARASAVLTGVGTVLADDPRLDVRLEGTKRQPLRVVLDPRLETPPTARILGAPGKALILASTGGAGDRSGLEAAGAQVEVLPGERNMLDLEAVLAKLAALEVNEVHAECGATLAGALLTASLVDELVVYLAPVLLGEEARPLALLGELASMQERLRLEILSERRVGPDLRLVLRPAAAGGG